MTCTAEAYSEPYGDRVRIRNDCTGALVGNVYDGFNYANAAISGMTVCQQPCPSAPASCIPPTFDQWGTETSPGTCGGVPAAPAPIPLPVVPAPDHKCASHSSLATWNPTRNNWDVMTCPTGRCDYDTGWCTDPVMSPPPKDVPAIPDIPTPPLSPAPGTTSKCPRGSAYDKPFFGLGGCDPGYVSSSGALVQGMGAQCICAETPEGRQVTQTPAEGEYQPNDLGLGGLMKMLPQLILIMVVVQVIGAFRK